MVVLKAAAGFSGHVAWGGQRVPREPCPLWLSLQFSQFLNKTDGKGKRTGRCQFSELLHVNHFPGYIAGLLGTPSCSKDQDKKIKQM